MSRLHEVQSNTLPTAYLVGVPTPDVSEAENQASLDELARLVHTLGYDVIGRTSQRRQGTGGASFTPWVMTLLVGRLSGDKEQVALS